MHSNINLAIISHPFLNETHFPPKNSEVDFFPNKVHPAHINKKHKFFNGGEKTINIVCKSCKHRMSLLNRKGFVIVPETEKLSCPRCKRVLINKKKMVKNYVR